MRNGDFVRDKANNLVALTGLALLRQHVNQAIIEAMQIDDIAQLAIGGLQDITESIVYLRLFMSIEALQELLEANDVIRSADEKIGELDAVLAQRDPADRRVFHYFVAVSSVAGNSTQVVGP